ncbi:hypothetical protein EVAR_63835_1 [Eumeta japonica]|uniref:Uncharacterized protein n=1 Tax=Eumeta variegata TaxID=151549 RepID=A0A4C1ZB31_EUMVA|nr:hypothetical protein EVAR_63835_1 [Eumeta japonica]
MSAARRTSRVSNSERLCKTFGIVCVRFIMERGIREKCISCNIRLHGTQINESDSNKMTINRENTVDGECWGRGGAGGEGVAHRHVCHARDYKSFFQFSVASTRRLAAAT